MARKQSGEQVVRDIKRQTRRKYSSEEKIRIVLDGMRGEMSIAEPQGSESGSSDVSEWADLPRHAIPSHFRPKL
jgi:transposase